MVCITAHLVGGGQRRQVRQAGVILFSEVTVLNGGRLIAESLRTPADSHSGRLLVVEIIINNQLLETRHSN